MMYGGHKEDYHDIETAWDNARAIGMFPKAMPRGGYGWTYVGRWGNKDVFQNIRNPARLRVIDPFSG
jgi:hypothetical protein